MERERGLRDGLLSTSTKAQDRPVAVSYVDHALLPLRVHVEREALLERADLALEILAVAWQDQVIEQGYDAPLPDEGEGGDERLDVYLRGLGEFSGRTTRGEDVSSLDGKAASFAFMEISSTLDEVTFRATLQHEFAHVLQFSIDTRASLMFFEASAVFQEALASPEQVDWALSLAEFQQYPNAPFNVDGIAWQALTFEQSFVEYGAAFFLLYLDETYGEADGKWIQELWAGNVQSDDVEGNEPDFVDVMEEKLFPILGGDALAKIVLDFATWRILVSALADSEVGYSNAEALSLDDLLKTRRLTSGALSSVFTFSGVDALHQGGCVVLEYTPTAESSLILSATNQGVDVDSTLQVSWLTRLAGQGVVRGTSEERGRSVNVPLEVAAGHTLFAAICAPKVTDPEDELKSIAVEVKLSHASDVFDAGMADAGHFFDAGDPVEPEPDVVCGCQGVPSRGRSNGKGPFAAIRPYVFIGMASISLIMMIIRGRRAFRRKKEFRGSSWSQDRSEDSKKK
ncbi:MAG: hypothetical protein GY822_20595 [Deltaproteobacteria bacterium]|nr:hypothetical protein [Deltaproteobacteria bacterium]